MSTFPVINFNTALPIEGFPGYLSPQTLTKEQKRTHDLFLKGLINSPLEITPGPNNTSIAEVPYQFLREHTIYQEASYAIGPHPYLIKRFFRTDLGDCKHLEIKPESSVQNHRGEENVQRQSEYSHKSRLSRYKVKSLSVPAIGYRSARFEVSLTTPNKTQAKPFDYLFVPGSSLIPAQFSSLENFSADKSSSSISFSFSMNLDLKESGMMPWNSAFFLVSREKKQYAPFEVCLNDEFLDKLSCVQMNRLFRSVQGNNPTSILLWGSKECGKTSFCAGAVNTIHVHSSGSPHLDYSVVSAAAPNPIIHYPSKLVNILDASSTIVRDSTALGKTFEFLSKSERNVDAVCLFLDMNEINDSTKIANVFEYYQYLTQLNKIAILILTKVEQYEAQAENALNSSKKVDEVLFGLKEYGFSKVVPLINYIKGRDTQPKELTKQAIVQVLYSARQKCFLKNPEL